MTVRALAVTERLMNSRNQAIAARVALGWLTQVLPRHLHVNQEIDAVLDAVGVALEGERPELYARVLQAVVARDQSAAEPLASHPRRRSTPAARQEDGEEEGPDVP